METENLNNLKMETESSKSSKQTPQNLQISMLLHRICD